MRTWSRTHRLTPTVRRIVAGAAPIAAAILLAWVLAVPAPAADSDTGVIHLSDQTYQPSSKPGSDPGLTVSEETTTTATVSGVNVPPPPAPPAAPDAAMAAAPPAPGSPGPVGPSTSAPCPPGATVEGTACPVEECPSHHCCLFGCCPCCGCISCCLANHHCCCCCSCIGGCLHKCFRNDNCKGAGLLGRCCLCNEQCGWRFLDAHCYSMTYAANPWYCDPRDGRVYAAYGYGAPITVPLAPTVTNQYNYGWGVPSGRLTPISRVAPHPGAIATAVAPY